MLFVIVQQLKYKNIKFSFIGNDYLIEKKYYKRIKLCNRYIVKTDNK